mmetsp:Transcript_43789/g.98929  ORF Transcript_43789/g.98929 Transcript_43789/m.98929 type:complete len:217 (+) Transcript_43789:402-1052(+)
MAGDGELFSFPEAGLPHLQDGNVGRDGESFPEDGLLGAGPRRLVLRQIEHIAALVGATSPGLDSCGLLRQVVIVAGTSPPKVVPSLRCQVENVAVLVGARRCLVEGFVVVAGATPIVFVVGIGQSEHRDVVGHGELFSITEAGLLDLEDRDMARDGESFPHHGILGARPRQLVLVRLVEGIVEVVGDRPPNALTILVRLVEGIAVIAGTAPPIVIV